MNSSRIILGVLGGTAFVAAILISMFANKLEAPLSDLWTKWFSKNTSGSRPAHKTFLLAIGFLVFLCLGTGSAALLEILSAPENAVAPNAGSAESIASSGFSPIIEEFKSYEGFTQTSPNVSISGDQANCNVSRSGGEQFLYRAIPRIDGDFRFTVIAEINSWTNNCQCNVGIGDREGEGVVLRFGYYGGGCENEGPTIIPAGSLSRTFDHECALDDLEQSEWPWFEVESPYRAAVEINGVQATLFVEGDQIEKFFGTNTYTGRYDTLWIGLNGDGDWPECSVTIESVTLEPLE